MPFRLAYRFSATLVHLCRCLAVRLSFLSVGDTCDRSARPQVTELCTGGELFDRILEKTESEEGRYSERDAMTLVTKILSAIAYCHDEHNICHRWVGG